MKDKPFYLPKDTLIPQIHTRIQQLQEIAVKLENALQDVPEGHLSISPHHKGYQFFHVMQNEVYIPKRSDLAQRLAQRDYDRRILSEVRGMLAALTKCVSKYCVDKVEGYFETLHPARKKMVQPIIQSDEDYVKEWEAQPYQALPPDEKKTLQTARGEFVRSKSEIIIANTLHHLGIPYKYERTLTLKRGRRSIKMHPDFTCLNVRTRQEFAWEHFGLMDIPKYANNATGKINLYLANGFYYGKNFLMTVETDTNQFSAQIVEGLAREFLL